MDTALSVIVITFVIIVITSAGDEIREADEIFHEIRLSNNLFLFAQTKCIITS